MQQLPIWIDCDPGVDDAAALLLALRLPEVRLVGVSTVAGNATLSICTDNARKLLTLFGADTPVYSGASNPLLRPYESGESFHGLDGLGGASLPEGAFAAQKEAAWDGLYEAAKRLGRLTLVVIGPMTNVAVALGKHPDLPDYLERIVFMGGSATRGNCTPCAEFNIHADPEAAQIVMRCPVPKVMCGLEVTEQAYLTSGDLARIGAHGGAVCDFFRDASAMLYRKNVAVGQPGWCVHDACAVLYCARPALFSGRKAGVFVETQAELTRGKTVTDLYSDKKFEERNTLVLLEIDRGAFVAAMEEALFADGSL